MSLASLIEPAKQWLQSHSVQLDVLSLGALVATFVGWLPHIGAGLSVVWFGLKIAIAWQEYRLNQRKLLDK
jgi:hypothetical protein